MGDISSELVVVRLRKEMQVLAGTAFAADRQHVGQGAGPRVQADLAECEGIAPSDMARALRLILLAQGIEEALLDGTRGPEMTLPQALEPFPADWAGQRNCLG